MLNDGPTVKLKMGDQALRVVQRGSIRQLHELEISGFGKAAGFIAPIPRFLSGCQRLFMSGLVGLEQAA